ncbi:MAG: hypothetical protein J6V53_05495 [Alphaproteobacteria bacterium]|nr:hypothetical protein [Alphaproteobacteria bacterium]
MSKNSLHEKLFDVWSVAHKFSGGNSKITKKIENYIRENCLEDTFSYQTASGQIKTLPVFELAEPRNGKQTPYFNPLAMDSFTQKRGAELKQKAKEFEEECPTVSLRVLRRQLGISAAKEKDLLKFIETKCVHDTFKKQDETGAETEELIFDYPMDSHSKTYLTIQKEGIETFIQTHQKELNMLGAKNIDLALGQIKPLDKKEGLLRQNDLFKSLKLPNRARSSFNNLFFNQFIHQTNPNDNTPLFLKRKSRQKTIYCIRKEDLPLFISQNKTALCAIGLSNAVIDHFLSDQKITPKTPEMITFSQFTKKYLHSNILSSLSKEIRKKHLQDTYETTDENGQKIQKPIFIKVRAKKEEEQNYVFSSLEALQAFARQNKELFLSHHVSLFQYENIFRKIDENIPKGEAIPVIDLQRKYHFFGREHVHKIPSFIGETYETTDENGQKIQKPLIVMKRQKSGHLKYYILKEAVLILLTRHQKELMVQNTTLKAILKNKPIIQRTDSMLSIENLARFLNYSTYHYPRISAFIETNCLNEKHINPQTNKEEDTFVYAACQSGTNSLMIETAGVKNFISKYAKELIELGVLPQNITKAISKATLNPNFNQEFVLLRRLRQNKFNEQAHLKKSRMKD